VVQWTTGQNYLETAEFRWNRFHSTETREYVQIVIRNAECLSARVYDPIKADQTHQTVPGREIVPVSCSGHAPGKGRRSADERGRDLDDWAGPSRNRRRRRNAVRERTESFYYRIRNSRDDAACALQYDAREYGPGIFPIFPRVERS